MSNLNKMVSTSSAHISYEKDTVLDNVVFYPGKFLHNNVNEASNEACENPNEPTDNPATDLQTSEALWNNPTTQQSINGRRSLYAIPLQPTSLIML